MRKLLIAFLFVPMILLGQEGDQKIDTLLLPKWSMGLDLLNFQDNYPAVLVYLERGITNDFAIKLEAGPVVAPEVYDGSEFISYFGYKSRVEFKLFYANNERRRRKFYFGSDFTWQQDWYTDEYSVWRVNFTEIRQGEFKRRVVGAHLRIGMDKFYASDKVILGWSAGFGRQFYRLDEPDENTGYNITDYPTLDPFSMNLRLSIGLVLKQYRDKPLFK